MHCHSNIVIQTQGNLCSLKYTVVFFSLLLTESASAYSLTQCHGNNINTDSRYSFFRGRKNKCFQEKCGGFKEAGWNVCDQIGLKLHHHSCALLFQACSGKVLHILSSSKATTEHTPRGRPGLSHSCPHTQHTGETSHQCEGEPKHSCTLLDKIRYPVPWTALLSTQGEAVLCSWLGRSAQLFASSCLSGLVKQQFLQHNPFYPLQNNSQKGHKYGKT